VFDRKWLLEIGYMDNFAHELSSVWWMYLLQGLSLIALGVLVFINPDILTALAAAFFIWVGLVLLMLAFRVWRFKHRYDSFKRTFCW
jgi:uncharacterized membrane protein HdeD (DUF308 family)